MLHARSNDAPVHVSASWVSRNVIGLHRMAGVCVDGSETYFSPKISMQRSVPTVGVVVVTEVVVVEETVVVVDVAVVVVVLVTLVVVEDAVVVVELIVVVVVVPVVVVVLTVVVVVDTVVVVDDTVVVVLVAVVVVDVPVVVVDVIDVVVVESVVVVVEVPVVVVEESVVVVDDAVVVVVLEAVVVVDEIVVVVVVDTVVVVDEIVVVVLIVQSLKSPYIKSWTALSRVSITPQPTLDFKKPSIVHSSSSTSVAGFAYARRASLTTETVLSHSSNDPTDKIILFPTLVHETGLIEVCRASAQSPRRLLSCAAWSAQFSPSSLAT